MFQFNAQQYTIMQFCNVEKLNLTAMLQKISILYIGRDTEIMEIVVRLLNKNDNWFGTGTTEYNEAKELVSKLHFDIVLLGCGIDEADELMLRKFFLFHRPSIKIVQHYGGGSGLLYNEIAIAIEGGSTPNFLS